VIISEYEGLYDTEEVLLDKYFNPGDYYRGAHVPYKTAVKRKLLGYSVFIKNILDSATKSSKELSALLDSCLSDSKD
jgi:hypothetical protein